jgi:hypothetical protein
VHCPNYVYFAPMIVVDTGFVKTRFITAQTGVEMLKVRCSFILFRFFLYQCIMLLITRTTFFDTLLLFDGYVASCVYCVALAGVAGFEVSGQPTSRSRRS